MKLLKSPVAPTSGFVLSSATGSLCSPGHIPQPHSACLPCPSPSVVPWLSACRPGRSLGSILDTKPDGTSPNLLLTELVPVLTLTRSPLGTDPHRPVAGEGPKLQRDGVGQEGCAEERTSMALSTSGHAQPNGDGGPGDTGCLGESRQRCWLSSPLPTAWPGMPCATAGMSLLGLRLGS